VLRARRPRGGRGSWGRGRERGPRGAGTCWESRGASSSVVEVVVAGGV
jgi:hypothetical protein